MDGVSQTLFWQYREAMPFLWNLYNRSAMFRRFYAASTSGLSSFCDFAFGDSTMLDHNRAYPNAPGCLAGGGENLFSLLRRRGYGTLGLMRASPAPGYAKAGFWGAWPEECGRFQCREEDGDCRTLVGDFLARNALDGRPFVLYAGERAARLDDAHPEKLEEKTFHGRVEKGYALLDRSAKHILDTLEESGFLANTVVAGFGPYGTDPWKHGVFAGRTHAFDPYADLCWTPLFIYRNGADAGVADQLLSMIDLKPTLMRLLFPDEPGREPASANAGVDVLSYTRKAAFTQSLFAFERENAGPSLGLAKSYAITDGDQRLVVSSDGGIPGEGGMELYYDPRDPGNTRNFLDFFQIDPDGAMTAFTFQNIVHPHFFMSFKPNLVKSVAESYNFMRRQLFLHIKEKERTAAARIPEGAAENLFPDDMFRRKRRRR
jgi:hypothetical protein